jgi:alpha-L-fucosidase
MGNSWSYVPNDEYKSANTIVHLLLRIVSRGGNLLLNIGPSPLGDFSDTAYDRLKEIGAWMKVHAEAVYGTKPLAPYEDGNVLYLQSKDSKTVFVYVLSEDKNDDVVLPASINLKNISVTKKSKIVCLDAPKEKVKFTSAGNASVISIPAALQNKVAGKYAVAFKITP